MLQIYVYFLYTFFSGLGLKHYQVILYQQVTLLRFEFCISNIVLLTCVDEYFSEIKVECGYNYHDVFIDISVVF